MAKKSKIAKFKKQQKLVAQYQELRQELKKEKNYEALRKLPKDSHPNRMKMRDRIDGRPRAYMRKLVCHELILENWRMKVRFQGLRSQAGRNLFEKFYGI